MNIITSQDNTGFAPPDSRWTAVDDNTYGGPGSPIGSGATEAEAVADLLDEIAEAAKSRAALEASAE